MSSPKQQPRLVHFLRRPKAPNRLRTPGELICSLVGILKLGDMEVVVPWKCAQDKPNVFVRFNSSEAAHNAMARCTESVTEWQTGPINRNKISQFDRYLAKPCFLITSTDTNMNNHLPPSHPQDPRLNVPHSNPTNVTLRPLHAPTVDWEVPIFLFQLVEWLQNGAHSASTTPSQQLKAKGPGSPSENMYQPITTQNATHHSPLQSLGAIYRSASISSAGSSSQPVSPQDTNPITPHSERVSIASINPRNSTTPSPQNPRKRSRDAETREFPEPTSGSGMTTDGDDPFKPVPPSKHPRLAVDEPGYTPVTPRPRLLPIPVRQSASSASPTSTLAEKLDYSTPSSPKTSNWSPEAEAWDLIMSGISTQKAISLKLHSENHTLKARNVDLEKARATRANYLSELERQTQELGGRVEALESNEGRLQAALDARAKDAEMERQKIEVSHQSALARLRISLHEKNKHIKKQDEEILKLQSELKVMQPLKIAYDTLEAMVKESMCKVTCEQVKETDAK